MDPDEAYELLHTGLMLDGRATLNLASFVTTWMEPQAEALIRDTLRKNHIDHEEYPAASLVEESCVHMLGDLFNAPDPAKVVGVGTIGSSEAIMLGLLAHKRSWRHRQQAAGQPTNLPNVVFGAETHVVWDKFANYFDVEMRKIPMRPDRFVLSAEDVAQQVDENTIAVGAVLGTTHIGESDPISEINDLLVNIKAAKGWDIPLHVDGASGGFVWPFLYPDTLWDFRLEQVRSINVSGHKFGLVYPGIGWLVFRERGDLPEDLVFYENYLGKRDATFTLNFSTGSAMVLAQYYNFARLGHAGYRYVMETMKYNARALAKEIEAIGEFELIGGEQDEQLPLVAFKLAGEHNFDEFDVAAQLAAERGWMVPAYTLPPKAEHVKIMRVLVKETLGHSLTMCLGQDIAGACATLSQKGGLHESDRKRVKTNTGF
jgi:glutamate decarboxylase